MKKPLMTLFAAAVIGSASLIPYHAQAAAVDTTIVAALSDLSEAGSYRSAIEGLIKLNVLSGYEDGTLRPNRELSGAEIAKMAVTAFGLQPKSDGAPLPSDISESDWYASYVRAFLHNGLKLGTSGEFAPAAQVTQQDLVSIVAASLNKKPSIVQQWVTDYTPGKAVTRGEAAQLIWKSIPHLPSANAEVTSVKALNPVTLEVTFSAPLTAADVNLDQAKKNFTFDNDMALLNVPQLKNGAVSTYIVPVTVQAPGKTYTMSYKGKTAGTFEAVTNKIPTGTTRQVTSDTFEIETLLKDGTADYGYVVEAYYGSRNGQELTLDENNRANGKTYAIISSLRDKSVTITPEGGQPIEAKYVPFTQATDGRQAPKYRLPAGETLKPGVTYTVSSDWSTIAEPTFKAESAAPLVIQSATAINETSVEIVLNADPRDELFALRSVTLTAEDGTAVTAMYKFQSRKGAAGTFDLTNGAKLAPNTTYKVTASGDWASADQVTVTTK